MKTRSMFRSRSFGLWSSLGVKKGKRQMKRYRKEKTVSFSKISGQKGFMSEKFSYLLLESDSRGPPSWISHCLVGAAIRVAQFCQISREKQETQITRPFRQWVGRRGCLINSLLTCSIYSILIHLFTFLDKTKNNEFVNLHSGIWMATHSGL